MDSYLLSFLWFDISVANIILLIGFFLSVWLLTRTVHEKKLSISFLSDHLTLFSLTSLFIGRVGAVLYIYPAISEKMLFDHTVFEKSITFIKSFLAFWHGGIDIFWAIGSFLFIFLLLCTLKNEHPLSWLDAFSLPFLLFLIFFSIASFFAGWNYGKPVSEDFWLAVSYESNEVVYSGTIHPVQLYAALLFVILFLLAWRIWGKKIRESWPSGIFGGIFLSSLFFLLSILEFFAGNISYVVFEFFPLTSIVFFGIGFALLVFMVARGHFNVFSRFKTIISQ